jgi:hypothetical protein
VSRVTPSFLVFVSRDLAFLSCFWQANSYYATTGLLPTHVTWHFSRAVLGSVIVLGMSSIVLGHVVELGSSSLLAHF